VSRLEQDAAHREVAAYQVLADYDDWLHATARRIRREAHQLTPTAEDHDDLIQHGRIAIWRALDTWDPERGPLAHYLTMRALGDMRRALRPRDKHALYGLSFDPVDHDLPVFPDWDGITVRAYYDRQLTGALNELEPDQREYVDLRFWGDWSAEQLAAHFAEPRSLWDRARTLLRRRLAHFDDAYTAPRPMVAAGEQITAMLAEGRSTAEIMAATGCHRNTVYGWARRLREQGGMPKSVKL
jgi:RNA polymerase sigma factor (sigma-70 family)